MDNYSLLLEEFHNEQLHPLPNQFIMIIDDIHNTKSQKKDIIARLKQHKSNLTSSRFNTKQIACPQNKTIMSNNEFFQNQRYLQEITHDNLKKQSDLINKQLIQLNKNIQQIKRHLNIFYQKQQSIHQLKYTSKKLKQIVQNSIKHQKIITEKKVCNNQKIIEQLLHQKTNLLSQNKLLTSKLTLKRYRSKDFNNKKTHFMLNYRKKINYISQCQRTSYNSDNCKVPQIYNRKNLEQHLRTLNILCTMRDNWTKHQLPKQFPIIQPQIQTQSLSSFIFLSKTQIINYYLQKLKLPDSQNIPQIIIQFYHKLTNSIEKLQYTIDNLNIKLKYLQEQYQQQINSNQYQQLSNQKTTHTQVNQLRKYNQNKENQIRRKSRSIFTLLQKQFKLTDKLKKLKNTLHYLIKPTNDNNNNNLSELKLKINKKKKRFTQLEKRNSTNVNLSSNSEISVVRKMLNLTKSNSILGATILIKKSSFGKNDQSFPVEQSKNNILDYYEQILSQNPKKIHCQQYASIKSQKNSSDFLQTILQNDLYRLFYGSIGYYFDKDQLQNQQILTNKIYTLVHQILIKLKVNLIQYIKLTLQESFKIQNKYNLFQSNFNLQSQQKYVIEGKNHDQSSDHEIVEFTKKSIHISNKQIKSDDTELILANRNNILLQNKLQLKKLPIEKQKNQFHYTSNYISTNRQRLSKQDRKIRNLVNHADSLRFNKKTFKEFICTGRRSFQYRLVHK